MSNLVIVAIPEKNDRVWEVSSEKVPHLTLLFLGDVDQIDNVDQIVQFVEHTTDRMLNRFYLPVDHRGELGEDRADVLFFKKNRYDYKAIHEFRSALLKDNNIRTAYDSTTQFEGPWKPHLTLGYPETPAKPEEQDYGIFDVCFDTISVWVDDYDGPEFTLKDQWDEWEIMETIPMDVAMSDIEHYGIKGMKWGVRKQEVGKGGHIRISNKTNRATVSGKNIAAVVGLGTVFLPALPLMFLSPRYRAEMDAASKLNRKVQGDAKFKKAIEKSKKAARVHNTAAKEINAQLPAFNNDKRWKNVDLTKDPVKQKQYDDAATKELINPAYANAAVKVYGSKSPSGRYLFEVENAASGTLKFRDTLREAHEARQTPRILDTPDKASSVTKRVIKDHNEMSDGDFQRKYSVSKKTYAKRVDKYGDPYMNSPLAKFGKAIPLNKKLDRGLKHADDVTDLDAVGGPETAEDNEEVIEVGFVINRTATGHILGFNPEDLEESMAQTVSLGADFVEHYGVKGMRWGVRKGEPGGGNSSGAGETKREGAQRYLDPQGHKLSDDILKTGIGILLPVVAPLTWPAQIRLIRGGARGIKAKALDRQEKKFVKNAMSPRNFAAIHNGSLERVNRDIDAINTKYPNPNKTAAIRKKYDDAVLKAMQDGYRASANSLTNKNQTMHLDVEFKNDGQDFTIHARQGKPTPLPVTERVRHADEDFENEEITVEITGKINRNANGHIVGFDFDHLGSKSMAQTASLGAAVLAHAGFDVEDDILTAGEAYILEHYGVKGMRWGHRTDRPAPMAVAPSATSRVPHGTKKKTKIKTEGGENHPASDDAIKVAQATVKLKKSGVKALSNQELRDVAQRLQLEGQVKQLTSPAGKKFVTSFFKEQAKQTAQAVVQQEVKGRIKR